MKPAPCLGLLLSACASTGCASTERPTAVRPPAVRSAAVRSSAAEPATGFKPTALTEPAELRAAESVDWKAAGDEAVAILRDYLRIDTSNAPGVPGASGDVRKAADFLEEALRREGIEVVRLVHPADPTRVFVVGRLRGDGSGGKALVLEHHMDVVPAEGKWTHPPFAAVVKDGWIYGRGSADDKGLGALHLMAMIVLRRQQIPLGRDVIFVANPDEEIGGERGASWLTAEHWKLLDPEFVLEEGGFGYQNRYRPGLAFEIQVEQKRVFWLELTATGDGGHGSVPRENALVVLERAVNRILSMPRPERITPTVRSTYRALAQEPEAALMAMESIVTDPIERARLVDSLALTRMQGSDKVNTQPRQARASLDVRLLPDTNPAEFLERLRRAIGDERVSIRQIHPPEDLGQASSVDSAAYQAIAAAIRRRYPGAIAIPTLSTGGTDSRNYRSRGVAAYGFMPFVVPEGDRLSIHDVDERVRVEDVQTGVRTMFEVAVSIAGKRSR